METAQILIIRRSITTLKLMIVAIMFLCNIGCVSIMRIDGPYEGKVVDAETGQPIVGAVVHGTWYRAHPGPGGASHTYYDSYEMLTGKNGEFSIPGQGLLMLSMIEEMDVTIFKAGYEQITPNVWRGLKSYRLRNKIIWDGNKATFRLKRLSMEERRKRLISMPVLEPGRNQKLLRQESNSENIEIERPSSSLYPLED